MITNDLELAIVRDQLARCERAIASLREELLPNHERNFNLYARPWLDMQREFLVDIDAYLAKGSPTRNGMPASSSATEVQPVELP